MQNNTNIDKKYILTNEYNEVCEYMHVNNVDVVFCRAFDNMNIYGHYTNKHFIDFDDLQNMVNNYNFSPIYISKNIISMQEIFQLHKDKKINVSILDNLVAKVPVELELNKFMTDVSRKLGYEKNTKL